MPRGSPASARSAGSSNAAILASSKLSQVRVGSPSMLERARQKDGRQVVPVDVDRDDVAYLGEIIGGLEPREHRAGARPAFAGVPEARRKALIIRPPATELVEDCVFPSEP